MFPINDPQILLDLHRERVDERIHDAACERLARVARSGRRHRLLGRWRAA